MKIEQRHHDWLDFEAKEKAVHIFKAVQGLEIDTAIFLLEWCSRKLLEQKNEISPDFLRSVHG